MKRIAKRVGLLLGVGVAVLIVLNVIVAVLTPSPEIRSNGSTPTVHTEPSGVTGTTGSDAASAARSRRYFADTATWNRPVSEFGRSATYERYAGVFYDFAGGGEASRRGEFKTQFRDYSVPIYDADDATGTARVYQANWASEQLDMGNVERGDTVPWNPDWKAGTGNDRALIVVNHDSGEAWEFWRAGEPGLNCFDGIGPNVRAGYRPGGDDQLCVATVRYVDNLYSASDADGTTIASRGMGVNKVAMVTRADEVLSGSIRHALELTVTNTMFGEPTCSPADDGSARGAGTRCGFYLPPATRLEWAEGAEDRCGAKRTVEISDENRARMVPPGLRIAIDISDAEIERWLDQRGYSGALRSTAKTFAVAFRDYGAVVAETGCAGVGIQTDGLVNPTSANAWKRAGIVDDDSDNPMSDLLDGLVTRDRLYVVEPPG